MVEVHKHPDHPEGDAERIAKRLRPSGPSGDARVVKGSSPNRTITTIHLSAGHGKPMAGPTAGDVRKPSDYDADDAA